MASTQICHTFQIPLGVGTCSTRRIWGGNRVYSPIALQGVPGSFEHIYPLRKNAELMGLGLNALGEQLDIMPLCPHTTKQSQLALIPLYRLRAALKRLRPPFELSS